MDTEPKVSESNGVTVVTGAARGMGFEIARAVAMTGAPTVAIDVRTPEIPQEVPAAPPPVFHRCDVSDPDQVDEVFYRIIKASGPILRLVNVAAVSGADTPAEELSNPEWDRLLAINLSGTFWCSRAVARSMIASGSPGSIVNFASLAARRIPKTLRLAHYTVSKAGVIALTEALAAEWGRYGIRVNCVVPGLHITSMAREQFDTEEAFVQWRDRAAGNTPLGRTATASEIVPLVLFLLSDAAGYITGQAIGADGGRGLWYL